MGTPADLLLFGTLGNAAVGALNNGGGSSGPWNEDPRNYWASAPTEDLFPYLQDITATPNLLTDEAAQAYMNMGKDYLMSDFQKALAAVDQNANARGIYDSGIRDANRNEQLDNLTRTLGEMDYQRSYDLATNWQNQMNQAQQWNLTDQQRQQQAMYDAWQMAMQQGMGANKGQPGAVAVTTSGTPAQPAAATAPTPVQPGTGWNGGPLKKRTISAQATTQAANPFRGQATPNPFRTTTSQASPMSGQGFSTQLVSSNPFKAGLPKATQPASNNPLKMRNTGLSRW